MTQSRKSKNLSREEDYRDYQDRDKRDGWPYPDEGGLGSANTENRGYGANPPNFDEEADTYLIVDAANATGLEENSAHTAGPLSTDRIGSDELDAAITEWLDQDDEIDADSIDVHANNGIVTLDGSVETRSMFRDIKVFVLSVPGVVEVRNNLRTIGVESHIPPDA